MKKVLTTCLSLIATVAFVFAQTNQTPTNITNNTLSKISFGFEKKINNSFVNMDGAVVCFKETFLDERGPEDASKMMNETENIGINNFGTLLSIDGRKTLNTEALVSTRISRTTANVDYNLKINLTAFIDYGIKCYLRDRFTQTEIALTMSQINSYTFRTSTDTNSYFNRFTLSFSSTNAVGTLPVQFLSTRAMITADKKHQIQWQVVEKGIQFYEIQQSTNGSQFSTIATEKSVSNTASNATQQYIFTYSASTFGKVYYRIASVDALGKIAYSNVLMLTSQNTLQTGVLVYPNVVRDNRTTIKMNNIEQGTYQVAIYSSNGQMAYTTKILHNQDNGNYPIQIQTLLAKGKYFMHISNGKMNTTQAIIIE